MKRQHNALPSKKYLNSIFRYDTSTGKLYWNYRSPGIVFGKEAGYLRPNGYLFVMIQRRFYSVHRLVWRISTGNDPGEQQIDHIDTNKVNNRFENLRLATASQNHHNIAKTVANTSGFKGVTWSKYHSMWKASIMVKGRNYHVGYFRLAEHAGEAIRSFRETLHKEFTHHG